MRAAVYYRYGNPKNIKVQEIDQPLPKDNEVLVKVHAASVNSWDIDLLTGKPRLFRFWGLFRPRFNILGADVAGQVILVGSKVTKFLPGDFVFGDLSACGWGSFAEYACGDEDAFIIKPDNISFEDAASIPQAGTMAYQSLTDEVKINSDDKILINGAGGGVGIFAIQLAKKMGAHVTAVDSQGKFELMNELGADRLIDYKVLDFTELKEEYNLIIDVVGDHSIMKVLKVLKPNGSYLMIGGRLRYILQVIFFGKLLSKISGKNIKILAAEPNWRLAKLGSKVSYGKIRPVVDKVFSLEDVGEAMDYLRSGKAQGKVVIKVIE